MDTLKSIKTRRSIREYKDKPIPKGLLENLIDAARFAPTARGVEPWEFIVITQKDTLRKIAEMAENGKFISQAAACMAVFCADTKYYLEDGCAATVNILIAARAYELASCWVAGDKKPYCNAISNLLNVPAQLKLVSLIALGYPKAEESFKIVDKRSLREALHWEKF